MNEYAATTFWEPIVSIRKMIGKKNEVKILCFISGLKEVFSKLFWQLQLKRLAPWLQLVSLVCVLY